MLRKLQLYRSRHTEDALRPIRAGMQEIIELRVHIAALEDPVKKAKRMVLCLHKITAVEDMVYSMKSKAGSLFTGLLYQSSVGDDGSKVTAREVCARYISELKGLRMAVLIDMGVLSQNHTSALLMSNSAPWFLRHVVGLQNEFNKRVLKDVRHVLSREVDKPAYKKGL